MKQFFRLDLCFDRLLHLAVVVLALLAAFMLRFEFTIPAPAIPILKIALWTAIILKVPLFHVAGFHRTLRRFAGLIDVFQVFIGNLVASVLFSAITLFWLIPGMPRSVLVLDFLLCFFGTSLVRFSVRICNEALALERKLKKKRGVLIYGAGDAGIQLQREIRNNPAIGLQVKGFLDDDPRKRDARIMGAPVFGCGREAASVVARLNKRGPVVEELIVAMPSATGRQMRDALANCRATGMACKTIPSVGEMLAGKVLVAQVRNVSLADLLGRKQVELDEAPIRSSIAGRAVMVTGGAGSIGSELCRQVAKFSPSLLIAFDQAESDLFKIDAELRQTFPDLEIIPAVGDLRDSARLTEVLERHAVESVFHAAAYKHVPLMEAHVLEAAGNNILGTWNLVRETRRLGISSFLMISSDKAVNPTNVMGATKRVCELIVSAQPPDGSARKTKCVSVRFGNVLGSNGSVVPIFQAQIDARGPVKVTHPEMRRYFMTIAEAAALVLQASTMGKGSELFVLDMGEQVRIVDLALNMIRLAGLEPYEDVDIQFTGLRPGEKLFEEINTEAENMLPTYHEKIKIFQETPANWEAISQWIASLEKLIAARQEQAVVNHIAKLVPEYQPSAQWKGAAARDAWSRVHDLQVEQSRSLAG